MSTDLPGPDLSKAPAAEPAPEAAPAPAAEPVPEAAPAPATPKAPGPAIVAAVGAALVAGLAYGFLAKTIDREIGWAVFGIAAAVSFALGKLGGNNPLLPPIGAVLSVVGLFFGQIFAIALFAHQELGASFIDLLISRSDITFEAWQETRGFMDLLFYGFAVYGGLTFTKKFAA